MRLFFLILALLGAASTASAEPRTLSPLTERDLHAFFDTLMPYALSRGNLPGAAVVVVRGDEVIFRKGYGFADSSQKLPVDVDRTLFRAGSISKLLTWIAVMQLVENGQIDLDTDINTYLDFSIPAEFGRPVTMRHLMTHTAGFENPTKNFFVRDPTKIRPLGDYLKSYVPAQIFPPGETVAYSNYGTSLAAYAVERISGVPFDAYIEARILKPLRMSSTTFTQPLPETLKGRLAKGHFLASDPAMPFFELLQPWPAGSMTTSAADMAVLMQVILGQGRRESITILKPETVNEMLSPSFRAVRGTKGMLLGFYEMTRDGHRVVGHAGDTGVFHSQLALMPDENVGVFVSFNGLGAALASVRFRTELLNLFIARYFASIPASPLSFTRTKHAGEVEGPWLITRRPGATFMSVTNLLSPPNGYGQISIMADEDGTIWSPSLVNHTGEPSRFRETAPFVFVDVLDPQRSLIFGVDTGGRPVRMVSDQLPPPFEFKRPGNRLDKRIWIPVISGTLGLLSITVISWIVRSLYSALRREVKPSRLYHIANCGALLWLLFTGGYIAFAFAVSIIFGIATDELDSVLRILVVLGVLAIGLLPSMTLYMWRTVVGRLSLSEKARSVLMLVAAISAFVISVNFNFFRYYTGY